MNKRILLAGVLGGLAMYLWTFLAHMVLPFGAVGVQEIPNDKELLDAMHAKLGNAHGLYLYPGFGLPADSGTAQKNAAMKDYGTKLAANPSGLLIYHPPGAQELTPGQLGTEFLTELIEALLVAWLLSRAGLSTYMARLGFAMACGILAAIATNVSYWNWYGFPSSYTMSYMFIEFIGFVAAGLVAAKVLKPAARAAAA